MAPIIATEAAKVQSGWDALAPTKKRTTPTANRLTGLWLANGKHLPQMSSKLAADKSLANKPSALLDAILFVTAAAITLSNVAERRLESI